MPQTFLWRGFLIAILIVALVSPAGAQDFSGIAHNAEVGVVVAAVAVAVLVIVLVRVATHHKPQSITGCVHAGPNTMSLTDETDKQDYALSGRTAGVKPGDRMTLQGKRKHTGGMLVFEIQKVAGDLGACQP